ncbi:hypothetical protein SAMN02745784_03136 [Tissierella praeacuta DSM 18095]|uniref:DUF5668 domain-containing protein n=1 Tax=Tissierella praeacuta DSM 18095 TaxID=1123404 RepID=A0A1M4ZP41_9FIRM|nr:hypothetical protein [Tissierella praeacuta]SHF19880.1 hypothetical protein SAMN02745784_03136 [Tissierella praeacuta DSM 18095]SUO99909.1 Uncharacterised protein [Tissierella praeacuta]
MKTKRVGTLSMAIVLIGFGILIFIAQISQLSAVELAIKFWPSILILLGGEILWFSFKEKKEEEKVVIRYDIFSVFMVMIVLGINICIYSLIETGAMNWIKTKISSETYNYELPFEEYIVDDSIEKIVINGQNYSSLTVRTDKINKIISSGAINITSNSEESAKKILDEDYININKSDNIIYVSFKENYNLKNLSITIPDNKKVEVNGGNDLDLILDNISNNFIVDNIRRVKLRVNKESDIKLETIINDEENFKGNVKWNIVQFGNEESPKYKGELVYANGSNIINILNSHEVEVNEI